MGSEKTAAAIGGLGELRRDPFAMLPFCGYNMGDYFAHWLSMTERTDEASLPAHLRRELVPQGRDDGKFLWPGFGENSRVLEWICRRLDGDAAGRRDRRSASCPAPTDLDLDGPRRARPTDVAAALAVDADEWQARAARHPRVLRRASATASRPSCVEQLDAPRATRLGDAELSTSLDRDASGSTARSSADERAGSP